MNNINRVVELDTNVLIEFPRAIFNFPESLVVIPRVVLEELDKLKDSKDGNVRRTARATSWLLDEISEANEGNEYMLMENGGYLKIEGNFQNQFNTYDPDKPDNRIMSVAVGYAKEGYGVTLYSNDVNVRVMTRQLATEMKLPLKAQRFQLIDKSLDEIDTGIKDYFLDSETMAEVRKKKYYNVELPYQNGEHIMITDHNNDKHQILAQYDSVNKRVQVLPDYKKGEPIWLIGGGRMGSTPVRPIDTNQTFLAHDILNTDKYLHFVMSKVAGAGKNFITTACAFKLLKQGEYDRLIVIKPMIAVDKEETGFLPGSKEEKIAPWFESFNDTVEELTAGRIDGDLDARIELDIVTHMRGRNIPRVIMIIDECQNFSDSAIKTLLTRAGENTKVILMGDLSQIDNPRLDPETNGLRIWAERARHPQNGFEHSTYILLESNFRSELSSWASSFYE